MMATKKIITTAQTTSPTVQMEEDKAIVLKNIKKTFYIREKPVDSIRTSIFAFSKGNRKRAIPALKGVNFHVKRGEIFGVVGRNGSGKSTLLKIIARAFPPDPGGHVEVHGKLIRLALGMGFDGNLTARENIYLNGSILGLSFKEIGEKFNEILDFSELHDFKDTKIKFYSSGMVSRLAFAIAIHVQADIFLMDEFFGGVGDVSFQEKSQRVFENTFLENRSIVLVSHDMGIMRKFCNRILVLDRGRQVALGTPDEVIPVYESLFYKP